MIRNSQFFGYFLGMKEIHIVDAAQFGLVTLVDAFAVYLSEVSNPENANFFHSSQFNKYG